MNQIIIAFYYDNDLDLDYVKKVVSQFDKSNKVNYSSDDFVTEFPQTISGKCFSVHFDFGKKNYKESVFDIMRITSNIAKGWKYEGPIKVKKYMFTSYLDKSETNDLPSLFNRIQIMYNK